MSQRFTPASKNPFPNCITRALASAISETCAVEELLSRSPERGGIGQV